MKPWILALTCMLTLTEAFAEPSASSNPPRRIIVVFGSNLPESKRQPLLTASFRFVLKLARPFDCVEFLRAEDRVRLASVQIPNGSPQERGHSDAFNGKFGMLKTWLLESKISNGRLAGQVDLPRLVDFIAESLKENELVTLIIIGDPRFVSDNPAEAAFNMDGGLIPGDGTVESSSARSIFGVLERRGQLHGVAVHWLTLDETWHLSELHQRAVIRFLSLFLAEQQASLNSLSSDIDATFEGVAVGPSHAMMVVRADPADTGLVMHAAPVFEPAAAIVPASTQVARATPAAPVVAPEMSRIEKTSSPSLSPASIPVPVTDNIGVAAIWEGADGEGGKVDIDLYVAAAPGHTEASWKQLKGDRVRLFRDVRSSSTQNDDSSWQQHWEYCEIEHATLEEPTVWLNVFQTTGPVHGVVRVQYRGHIVDRPFYFNVANGNAGFDAALPDRQRSRYWLRIDLRDFAIPAEHTVTNDRPQ